jgi:hypothetical protein
MRDLPGIALIALGCGLLVSGVMKRQARMRSPEPAGAIRPEFAAMGEIARPMILFAVALVALKTLVFYFLFDGARFLPPLTFGGFLFVLAAYAVWLVLATKRPARQDARLAESRVADATAPADAARDARLASAASE